MTTTRPFYRLPISIVPAAAVGSLVMGVTLFAIALFLVRLSVIESLVGAVIGVAMHWILEIVHNIGHAYAAQSTGYPMTGIRLGFLGIFAMSLYPKDEPTLPARTHIRRALGGPFLSGVVAVIFLVLAILMGDSNSLIAWLVRWGLFESVFVFSLGAFLPLGFNDGSTILYWLRH